MAYGEGSRSVLVTRRAVGVGAEVEEEKWLMHYSSLHQILLVGEGDFSFALCLANAFGSASNIVASSLDSYDALIINYKQAKSNLETLEKLGASLLHGVDATKMMSHADLRMRKFDRIIYNFPHAGFYGREDGVYLVMMHRTLVSGFLHNAKSMLRPYGEVHVSHKTTPPFCHWNIPELALLNSLTLIDCTDFRIEDFPGYGNKRGAGSRCDEPFPLGKCCTFKFIVTPSVLEMPQARSPKSACGTISQSLQRIPICIPGNWSSYDWQPPGSCAVYANNLPPEEHTGQGFHVNIENECFRIFGEYLNHSEVTFGRIDYDVATYTREALKLGYGRYMAIDSGRSTDEDYINILEKLHHLSILRREWLLSLLFALDQQISG